MWKHSLRCYAEKQFNMTTEPCVSIFRFKQGRQYIETEERSYWVLSVSNPNYCAIEMTVG